MSVEMLQDLLGETGQNRYVVLDDIGEPGEVEFEVGMGQSMTHSDDSLDRQFGV